MCCKSRFFEDSIDNCIIVPTIAFLYRQIVGPRTSSVAGGAFKGRLCISFQAFDSRKVKWGLQFRQNLSKAIFFATFMDISNYPSVYLLPCRYQWGKKTKPFLGVLGQNHYKGYLIWTLLCQEGLPSIVPLQCTWKHIISLSWIIVVILYVL